MLILLSEKIAYNDPQTMENVFEKIINREIPAFIVYEDDIVLAFLDIHPNNKGHTLIVPKKTYRNVFDIDPDVFAHMAKAAKKISIAILKATEADGINIVMNNESAANQAVFHAHLHIIPRFAGDGVFEPPRTLMYKKGEDDEVAKRIIKYLSSP